MREFRPLNGGIQSTFTHICYHTNLLSIGFASTAAVQFSYNLQICHLSFATHVDGVHEATDCFPLFLLQVTEFEFPMLRFLIKST